MAITIAARAKLNLTLFITGRLDNGYHTLDTVMQSIDLSDRVTISLNSSGAIQVQCNDPNLCSENNLAYLAAGSYLEAVGKTTQGVQIFIEKNIPIAAGLGGGSADAAAVLLGLNRLMGSILTLDQLQQLGLRLGADVPFCLAGGTCRATGIGEILVPLNSPSGQLAVVCIKPCDKPSTGKMYQKYDENKGLSTREKCDIIDFSALGSTNRWDDALYNDFLPLYDTPHVCDALLRLKDTGALGAGLSGSGPTVFGVYPTEKSACNALSLLSKKYPECFLTHFCDCGYEILVSE